MEALILVDIQNDFLPGGALAVREGDAVIAVANRLQQRFGQVAATQDWHPPGHGSFAASHPGKSPGERIELGGLPQVLWPVHCVQGSPGADFAPGLDRSRVAAVFPKGSDPDVDSYSGFFDNGKRHDTGLHAWLQARGVESVYVCGLATDYCVKYTALDAAALGYRTFVVLDACRGVELRPGDIEAACREMEAAGIVLLHSENLGA